MLRMKTFRLDGPPYLWGSITLWDAAGVMAFYSTFALMLYDKGPFYLFGAFAAAMALYLASKRVYLRYYPHGSLRLFLDWLRQDEFYGHAPDEVVIPVLVRKGR